MMSIPDDYLSDVARRFRDLKSLADRAIAQAPDAGLFQPLDEASNSIAVLMRHLAGNMRSRWRDFLTTDGEKPDRHRDREFEAPPDPTRAAVAADWESGWACLFDELGRLGPSDLGRTVTTRHEPTSVVSAINRQLAHAAMHVGQIVMLARHAAPGTWQPLSIPRGQSEAYNEKMKRRFEG
jgi:hypothetical protein